jgi:hypothetical protein
MSVLAVMSITTLRGQLATVDELLRTSSVENEFVRRSLEHRIRTLSESFQEHSIRALRCSIARSLLVGSFRDFAARLADSPLLQFFCKVAQLDRVKVPAKSTIQRYATWLPEEDMREVINVLLRKTGASMADGKQVLDLEEPLDLSAMLVDTTCVTANIHFSGRLGTLARRSQESDAVGGTDPRARTQIADVRAASLHYQVQPLVDGNDPYPAHPAEERTSKRLITFGAHYLSQDNQELLPLEQPQIWPYR